MADEAPINTVASTGDAPQTRAGDVPDRVRRRYLTDGEAGAIVGFYVDASIAQPAFRDHGRRLSTDRNDPHVVRDMVAIAQHRGWTTLSVRGETAFRREVWTAARAAGLEVEGYRPSARDGQLAERRGRAAPAPLPDGAAQRLRTAEIVIRDRVTDRADQDRILRAARTRLAAWLELGVTFVARDARRDRSR